MVSVIINNCFIDMYHWIVIYVGRFRCLTLLHVRRIRIAWQWICTAPVRSRIKKSVYHWSGFIKSHLHHWSNGKGNKKIQN